MSKVHDLITDRVLEKLEAGTVPWEKPWGGKASMPQNLKSGKAYRGINVFLLHSLGYESPYFLTFNQCKARGGHVRKGEKGCPVVFWKWLDVEDDDKTKRVPMLRYYTVFNTGQCEGIDTPTIDAPERHHEPIRVAQAIVEAMPHAPGIVHGYVAAAYSPLTDIVRMPKPERFDSNEAYYSTLFHELTHSTGHSDRLGRNLDAKLAAYGSPDYSREELVAEMGAAFLCGETGILEPCIDQSSAYIAGWLKALKNDRKLVVTAAGQAQKAADHILNRTFE